LAVRIAAGDVRFVVLPRLSGLLKKDQLTLNQGSNSAPRIGWS